MLVIGIICLFVAAISYFKYLNDKNKNNNEAKWQCSLAIIFLILGIILIGYWITLHR